MAILRLRGRRKSLWIFPREATARVPSSSAAMERRCTLQWERCPTRATAKFPFVREFLSTAHSAVLPLTFYTGTHFPMHSRYCSFIGLTGSWNRSKVAGYLIPFVPFLNGKPAGPLEDFVRGWILNGGNPGTALGRPVSPYVAKDGSLLITDDVANKIWRVQYTARR